MRELLASILSNIENKEVDYYLKTFSQKEPSKFAVIKVNGECIKKELEPIVDDLASLQELKLTPIVLFDCNDILIDDIESQNPNIDFFEVQKSLNIEQMGKLVTEVMKKLDTYSKKHNLKFVNLSEQEIFEVEFNAASDYSENILKINTNLIEGFCKGGLIPIIVPIGFSQNKKFIINTEEATRTLIESIKPLKYIILSEKGGVVDSQGEVIQKISIVEDYEALFESSILYGEMLLEINEIKNLLEKSQKGYSVQITSPKNLLTELFTFAGAGTKIVLGYKINYYDNIEDCNKKALLQLIESSLGRKIDREAFLKKKFKMIILEEDYDGAAVLIEYDDLVYLDKLVVSKKTQSAGLGTKLFEEMLDYAEKNQLKAVFWRSKITNQAIHWYFKKLVQKKGGCQVTPNWVIFWIGDVEGRRDEIIKYCVELE